MQSVSVKCRQAFIAGVLLSLMVTSVSLSAASANGRVAKFIRQEAGPYGISLGTIPDTPVVGPLHLTMNIIDLSSSTFVRDAQVTVATTGPDSNSTEIGPLMAENNLLDPNFYDVTTSVDRVGTWTLTVSVSSELGNASSDFAIEVKRANPFFGIFTWVTVLVFFAVVGLGLLPYLRERGRRRKRR